MAEMKVEDIRAMTEDQREDAITSRRQFPDSFRLSPKVVQ